MNRSFAPIKVYHFHGGVHPPENKTQTCHKGIQLAKLPKELVLPLQQHIGAPAKAIVKVGDYVLKGQKIAEANGFVSTPLHAPTSGTVVAINEERPVQHPSGIKGKAIVIKSDGKDLWINLSAHPDYKNIDKKTLLNLIREAGISGMGGAGFPSAVKLSVKENQKVQTLILNSVECEPYITADDVLIREYAREILIGLEILNHILQPEKILIGIEDNKPEAITAYKTAMNNSPLSNVYLAVVPTKYPSGGEKQLIQLLTGKEVPAGGLPIDLGIICQNTGTVLAIHDAIIKGEPLISRITTVTGSALNAPQNFRCLIGTPFRFLLDSAGIRWQKLTHIIMGGPMMGFAVQNPQVPVVKTTNCILAGAEGELLDPDMEQPCIRCGSCAEVCPANLLPQQLYWYSKAKELEKTQLYHIADCIECGACSYVCPSNIPLVQYFRFAKGEIRNKNIELKKSELSRERFEARKARLEREETEKEAKRLAKLEARKQKITLEAGTDTPSSIGRTPNVANTQFETAFTQAKTKAATTSKQWKEAEKALISAQKSGAENRKQLAEQVKQLEQIAQQAQQHFKKLLEPKKENQNNTPDIPVQNELEKQIENIREQSSQASIELKNIKKALLSAKSGQGDFSSLEQQAEQARNHSEQLKTQLRDLLAKQKQTRGAEADTHFVNTLKIEQATLKVQIKKLEKSLDAQPDNSTETEIKILLGEARKKLELCKEELEKLNPSSIPTKSTDPTEPTENE